MKNLARQIECTVFSLAICALIFTLLRKLDPQTAYSDFIVGNIAWSASNKTFDLICAPVIMATFLGSWYFINKNYRSFKSKLGKLWTQGLQIAPKVKTTATFIVHNPFFYKIVLWVQIPISFMYLFLLPSSLKDDKGNIFHYDTQWILYLTIAIFIILSARDLILRYKKPQEYFLGYFSPFTFLALIAFIKFGHTVIPVLPIDDYHFGEGLLGYLCYSNGLIPYIDYVPSHGLLPDDLRMIVSSIFYDGTISSISQSGLLTMFFVVSGIFFAVYKITKNVFIAFAICLSCSYMQVCIVTLFSCLFFYQPEKKLSYTFIYITLSIITILCIPPQGVLIVASASIFFLYSLVEGYREFDRRFAVKMTLFAIIMVGLAVFTPLLQMIIASIQYVLENGTINQLSYGIPWKSTMDFPKDFLRFSWIFVPLIICFLAMDKKRFSLIENRFFVFTFILSMLYIPYSMGRIDPGMSRTGIVSVLVWTTLFPLTIYMQRRFSAIICIMISISAGLILHSIDIRSANIKNTISFQNPSPSLMNMNIYGFDQIGFVHADKMHIERVKKIDSFINSNIGKNETFLNLTSRNALYFYLDKVPPVNIPAAYNMVPPAQQRRNIERLEKNIPPIALLFADNIIHDGGGLALRTPILYRWVIENYIPLEIDGVIYGISKKHALKEKYSVPVISYTGLTLVDVKRRLYRAEISGCTAKTLIRKEDTVLLGDLKCEMLNVFVKDKKYFLEFILKRETIDLTQLKNQMLKWQPSEETLALYYAFLFFKSTSVPRGHLNLLPVAWGRSSENLLQKTDNVLPLGQPPVLLNNIKKEGTNYSITGKDSFLIFDIGSFNLRGKDADLLVLTLSIERRTKKYPMQIFWERKGECMNETDSIRLTAMSGDLIIPLDASSFWMLSPEIDKIRIDIDGPIGTKFNIENISLRKRVL